MKRSLVVITFISFFLISCLGTAPKKGEQTDGGPLDGAIGPLTFEVVGDNDLGLYLIGSDPVIIDLKVKNSTSLPVFDVGLKIDESDGSAGMTFVPNDSGLRNYPGLNGTCASVLEAQSECIIKIVYNALTQGIFTQKLTLNYKNILKSDSLEQTLKVQAGEPAALIFTSEQTIYDFGIKERNDCNDIEYESMQVKNVGGLPATGVTWGISNSPSNSIKAYKVYSNDCPASLQVGQTCNLVVGFQSQNWGPDQDCDGDGSLDVAPDADDPGDPTVNYAVTYGANLRADYTRDPLGGASALNAIFSTLSTTIEGRMEVGGIETLSFDDGFLIAGNTAQKTFKVANKGYKEAILRAVHVRRAGAKIATCIKVTSGTGMECREPSDPTQSSGLLPKIEFPFTLVDKNECFDEYSKMSYTRNTDGSLSDETITQVTGQGLDGSPGGVCFFDIFFKPAVGITNETGFDVSGSINLAVDDDYEFVFEYDTTWKNYRDNVLTLRGENDAEALSMPLLFSVIDAYVISPARLYVDQFLYDDVKQDQKVLRYMSNNFDEKASDDGSIYAPIYVQLIGDDGADKDDVADDERFAWDGGGLLDPSNYTVTNLPAGLSLSIKKVDKDLGFGLTEYAEVSLTGQAGLNGSAHNVTDLTISFHDSAFPVSNASDIFHSEKSNLSVKFIDDYKDFSPDPGDPEMDVFVDLGRLALVSSSDYEFEIKFSVKNSADQEASLTEVKEGSALGQVLNAEAIAQHIIGQDSDSYYKRFFFGTDSVTTETLYLSTLLNPFFYGGDVASSEKQRSLFYDVYSGATEAEAITRYKKISLEYTDGATFNDDGTTRRKKKINVHWTGILVQKGFLVIEDTGTTPHEDVNGDVKFVADNIDFFQLELKNDGTGPIPFIKMRDRTDDDLATADLLDAFDYSKNMPSHFIDFTTCDEYPECKILKDASVIAGKVDCSEIVFKQDEAWPVGAALDCGGADSAKCLTAGNSCVMMVFNKVPNTGKQGRNGTRSYSFLDFLRTPANAGKLADLEDHVSEEDMSDELSRDFSVDNAEGTAAEKERNWNTNVGVYKGAAMPQMTFSVEYLDGDYLRPDEDYENYGDRQIISGKGDLASGVFTYKYEYESGAEFVVDTPKPIESAITRRAAFTLPLVVTDAPYDGAGPYGFEDLVAVDIPAIYIPYLTNGYPHDVAAEDKVKRAYLSRGALEPLVVVSDDANYDYIFHGGTFPYTVPGKVFKLSFRIRNKGNLSAKDLNLTFSNITGSELTHTITGLPDVTEHSGNFTVEIDYLPTAIDTLSEAELTFTYENQREYVNAGKTAMVKETVTKKIKIMAASSDDVVPKLSSTDLNTTDPDPLNHAPFGPTVNYTLKYSEVAPESQTIKDIIGGVGISRRFTLENFNTTLGEDMKNLKIFFKTTVASGGEDNAFEGLTVTQVAGEECEGIDLAAGDTCQFDIEYKAPVTATSGIYDRFLVLSYAIEEHQYITNIVNFKFEAASPAIISVAGITATRTVTDPVTGSYSPLPLWIKFGDNYNNGTLVSSCDPMESKSLTYDLVNNEAEDASLIRAYRCNKCKNDYGGTCLGNQEMCCNDAACASPYGGADATAATNTFLSWFPPDTGYTEIATNKDGSMVATAHGDCFYGPAGFPTGKGFRDDLGHSCDIKIDWSFKKEQFGASTVDYNNILNIEYYSSELTRIPTNIINIVLSTWLRPNPVTQSDTNFYDVTADSDGRVNFTFKKANPVDANCGDITKYKVFYKNSTTGLDNIYSDLGKNYFEIDAPLAQTDFVVDTDDITLPKDLDPGSYYFFKIAAIRELDGHEYIAPTNSSLLRLITPPEDSFYDHDKKILFDSYLLPGVGMPPDQYFSPSDANDACDGEEYSLKGTGSDPDKVLINEAVWDHITADNFTEWGDPWLKPHWLSDPPRDITPYFPGLDCAATTSPSPDNTSFYAKSCADCSCNTLPLNVGRFLGALNFVYNFVEPDSTYFAHARCYSPVNP